MAVNGDASPVAPGDLRAVADLGEHATQILGAYGNRMPQLARDGRTLVFLSTRAEISQLYTSDAFAPRTAARRLLDRPEAISTFTFVPRSAGPEQLVFLSAPNQTPFAMNLDGSDVRALSSGPALRYGEPLPMRAGSVLLTARDQTHAQTQLHELTTLGVAQPRVLYTDPGDCRLLDVSADGARALLVRTGADDAQELVSVDLLRGVGRTAYTPGPAGRVHAARFVKEGKRVLVATDGAAEANVVLTLDARTDQETWRYVDPVPTGHVREITVSRDGKTAALLVSGGGRERIRFLDLGRKPGPKGVAAKSMLRDAELAPGDGTLGAFTADGARLLLRWATPNEPSALYTIAVASGRPSALLAETRPELAELPPLTAVNLEIPSFDGARIPLNLYVPKGGVESKPVLVMLHGGPADVARIGYNPIIRFYTAFGFAVVEPNLRGSTGFGVAYERADDGPKRLDSLRDLQTVGEWLQTQPWADAARVALWGGSYGGYLVLMGLTRQPALWRAGVDFAGPSSWRSFFASLGPELREQYARELGSPERDGAFLDSISPLAAAGAITSPLFVFQGQLDTRVPRAETDVLVTSLRARQVPVEYFVAEGAGHAVQDRATQAAMLARSTLFLRKHLVIP